MNIKRVISTFSHVTNIFYIYFCIFISYIHNFTDILFIVSGLMAI